ncbi:MAG: hypothetical protein HY827_09645 [Actinobacteria bacterium]|nr:hypothetical protein [Actinomycetota bacterium]
MTTSPRTARGPLAAAFAVTLTVSALILAAPASAGGCANADISPATADEIALAETATRCLVNTERRRHGLRRMRFNRNLHESSAWQASDMVSYAYFDHQRAGGPSLAARITRFGSGGTGGYMLGENIAWSTAGAASPREMVQMWMDSPGHRANILRRKFREQAVAAVMIDGDAVGGDYDGAGPLVIYVNQFGTRY